MVTVKLILAHAPILVIVMVLVHLARKGFLDGVPHPQLRLVIALYVITGAAKRIFRTILCKESVWLRG